MTHDELSAWACSLGLELEPSRSPSLHERLGRKLMSLAIVVGLVLMLTVSLWETARGG
jgi:hypothetical protein